jgi:hypothetical protein
LSVIACPRDRREQGCVCPPRSPLGSQETRADQFFKEFHGAGDDAIQAKGRIVARIIEELAVHTYLGRD